MSTSVADEYMQYSFEYEYECSYACMMAGNGDGRAHAAPRSMLSHSKPEGKYAPAGSDAHFCTSQ
ncbi:hypothetical protein JCM24511_09206 [Saitozyma sp. JCM 24511]|nr:hypothetical protein JCM24511_09206 [Saitozyma sp. JCM 24511]